jgi:hypothetical protein
MLASQQSQRRRNNNNEEDDDDEQKKAKKRKQTTESRSKETSRANDAIANGTILIVTSQEGDIDEVDINNVDNEAINEWNIFTSHQKSSRLYDYFKFHGFPTHFNLDNDTYKVATPGNEEDIDPYLVEGLTKLSRTAVDSDGNAFWENVAAESTPSSKALAGKASDV